MKEKENGFYFILQLRMPYASITDSCTLAVTDSWHTKAEDATFLELISL